jgi:hypothetical protein
MNPFKARALMEIKGKMSLLTDRKNIALAKRDYLEAYKSEFLLEEFQTMYYAFLEMEEGFD